MNPILQGYYDAYTMKKEAAWQDSLGFGAGGAAVGGALGGALGGRRGAAIGAAALGGLALAAANHYGLTLEKAFEWLKSLFESGKDLPPNIVEDSKKFSDEQKAQAAAQYEATQQPEAPDPAPQLAQPTVPQAPPVEPPMAPTDAPGTAAVTADMYEARQRPEAPDPAPQLAQPVIPGSPAAAPPVADTGNLYGYPEADALQEEGVDLQPTPRFAADEVMFANDPVTRYYRERQIDPVIPGIKARVDAEAKAPEIAQRKARKRIAQQTPGMLGHKGGRAIQKSRLGEPVSTVEEDLAAAESMANYQKTLAFDKKRRQLGSAMKGYLQNLTQQKGAPVGSADDVNLPAPKAAPRVQPDGPVTSTWDQFFSPSPEGEPAPAALPGVKTPPVPTAPAPSLTGAPSGISIDRKAPSSSLENVDALFGE